MVTKLDRLARSLPDARDIAGELTSAGVKLNIGGSLHDPDDPVGRLQFNVLAMIAEFEPRPDQDADPFSVARSTVYRAVSRAGGPAAAPPRS